MKKRIINGINASLELNDKYIYVIVNNTSGYHSEHIVWFEEIEDVFYKKPTRVKRGFITLYLSTKSFVTKRKKIYTIILEKIDEKNLETNYRIYSFIKGITETKKVKIIETIDKELKEEELEKDTLEQLNEIEKNIEKYVEQEEKKQEIIEAVGIDEEYLEETEKKKQQEKKDSVEISEEIFESISLEKIEEEALLEENKEPLEQEEIITEDKKVKATEKLEKRIRELEKELQKLTYKEIIIGEYVDETINREKIDKLIIEIKKLLDRIDKLKKEIIKHEKILNGNEFIKLDNGNVIVLSISKSFLDENELNKYVESYKRTVVELERVEKDTKGISRDAEKKRKDIGITDEDYERRINEFRGVKENREYIKKLINEAKEDLGRVKWRIETTIEPRAKFRFVFNDIKARTKRLAALTALNELRPGRSRLSMLALTTMTGLSAMQLLYGFEIRREEYNEIVQREILEGLDNVDTKKARLMILNAKDQIDEILNDCEKKYGEYPQFASLRESLLNVKEDIEKQDKELSVIEDKVVDYKLSPKIKTLRYRQESKE